jgi:hypothetical protein
MSHRNIHPNSTPIEQARNIEALTRLKEKTQRIAWPPALAPKPRHKKKSLWRRLAEQSAQPER